MSAEPSIVHVPRYMYMYIYVHVCCFVSGFCWTLLLRVLPSQRYMSTDSHDDNEFCDGVWICLSPTFACV